MNEIHVNNKTALEVYFVRFNDQGQVALSDGSAWETWGTGGHTIADYRVLLPEIGTASGHYVGNFDVSGNVVHSDIRIYFVAGYKKVAAVYTRISEGYIIWNGTSEVEIKGPDQVVSSLFATAGFTVGSALTMAGLFRDLAAFLDGTWRLKTGSSDTWQVSDADAKNTPVLEVKVKEAENPYKETTRL